MMSICSESPGMLCFKMQVARIVAFMRLVKCEVETFMMSSAQDQDTELRTIATWHA